MNVQVKKQATKLVEQLLTPRLVIAYREVYEMFTSPDHDYDDPNAELRKRLRPFKLPPTKLIELQSLYRQAQSLLGGQHLEDVEDGDEKEQLEEIEFKVESILNISTF